MEMWKCPKCGREFKKVEQSHYCGEKPTDIDTYILMQDEEKRKDLELVRETLRKALPEAEEKISWSMPTYWKRYNIIHFAAMKKHIGLYPGAEAVAAFAEKLDAHKFKYAKGSIQMPYGKIDPDLVREIAQWCRTTGNHA